MRDPGGAFVTYYGWELNGRFRLSALDPRDRRRYPVPYAEYATRDEVDAQVQLRSHPSRPARLEWVTLG